MRLIKTNEPQILDSMLGIEDHVYFRIGDWTGSTFNGENVVVFEIQLMTLSYTRENRIKQVPTDNGRLINVPIVIEQPNLNVYRTVSAIFRQSTYFGPAIGNPKPEEFPQKFVEQLTFITEKWEGLHGGWTGNEIQRPRFWNLKDSDVTVLSDQDVESIMNSYEVQT